MLTLLRRNNQFSNHPSRSLPNRVDFALTRKLKYSDIVKKENKHKQNTALSSAVGLREIDKHRTKLKSIYTGCSDLGQKSRAIQYLKELVWEPPGGRLNNDCSLFPVLKSQLIIHFVSYVGVLS